MNTSSHFREQPDLGVKCVRTPRAAHGKVASPPRQLAYPTSQAQLGFFGSITLFRRLLHGIGALAHLSLQLNRTSRVANCTLSSSEKTSRSSWQDCRCSSLTVFDTASPAGVSEMRFARRPRGAGRHSARPSASTKASMASVAVQRGCPKPKGDPVSREKCLSALLVGHCWKDGK
jgi:hypothetical protein